MLNRLQIPLFPLNSVLFPGGVLPLRVFEPRYMDMVSACMREQSGFGVCLILSGKEVGEAATTYDVGSLARIIDWDQREDGMLGITAQGQQRFRILSSHVRPGQLLCAEVELLEEPAAVPIPARFAHAVPLLRDLIERLGGLHAEQPASYDDACWVSGRLAELLPIGLPQRQYLLQLDDPVERLERLCDMWDCMQGEE